MTNGAIFAWWCKHLFVSETNVIYCRIMCDQLCLYTLTINVPNCASGVDWTCSYHSGSLTIPIKTCDRSTIIWINISENLVLFVCVCFFLNFPDSKIFCSRGQNIFSCSINIWNPHNFSWWKLMLEFINFSEAFVRLFKIQVNDVHLVVHGVCVITWYGHLKFIVFSISKRNRIILKPTFVRIYLFSEAIFWKLINLILNFCLILVKELRLLFQICVWNLLILSRCINTISVFHMPL